MSANWHLSKAPILRERLEERDTVFLDNFISQGKLPSPQDRHPMAVKLARAWVKIYISKVPRSLQLQAF